MSILSLYQSESGLSRVVWAIDPLERRECSFIDGVCIDYLFFFQAEDGIRDLTVTGVQTCALPISIFRQRKFPFSKLDSRRALRGNRARAGRRFFRVHIVRERQTAPPFPD